MLYLGIIQTEFLRHAAGRFQIFLDFFIHLMAPLGWFFFKSPEEGAQTTIYLASDIHLDNVTGKYFRFSFCIQRIY